MEYPDRPVRTEFSPTTRTGGFLCPKRAQPTRRNHDRRGQRQPAGGIDRERSEAARNRLRGQIPGGRRPRTTRQPPTNCNSSRRPNCPKPKRPPSTSKSLKPRTPPTRRKNSRTNGRRRSPRKPACPSHCSTAPPSKKCKPTARRSPTTSPRRPSRRCTPPPNPTSLPRHPTHPAIGFAISSSSRNANNPPHRKKV